MLLERSKGELEASMENALLSFDELRETRQSFFFAQERLSRGVLDEFIHDINRSKESRLKEKLKPEDFAGFKLMSTDFLLRYNHETGFFPYVVGFVSPRLDTLALKLSLFSHTDRNTMRFSPSSFDEPPFSRTGILFSKGESQENASYKMFTYNTHEQYSRNNYFDVEMDYTPQKQIYNFEFATLKEIIDEYVARALLNDSAKQHLSLKDMLKSVKQEWEPHFSFITQRRWKEEKVPNREAVAEQLRLRVDKSFETVESLEKIPLKKLVDASFRFGTSRQDIEAGRVYSPLNDMIVYFQ